MKKEFRRKNISAVSANSAREPVPVIASANYFLPYQNAWIDDEMPVKLYEKSRRIGATYATSYRCFRKCLNRRNFTQWVSSRDLFTAKEFITEYIQRWCKLANVAATGLTGDNVQVFDPTKDVKAFIAEFPLTNCRIVSLSSTPEVFAGKGGDVLLDEVDLHENQGNLIDMAMPCTTWGGQLEAVSAYKVDGSPASVFAKLCQDAKGENPMHASFHRTTILDAIDQGFVEKVNEVSRKNLSRDEFLKQLRAKCRTEAAWQSQYMCNPQDDGGALLTYAMIRQCEASAAELQYQGKETGPGYMGIDIGRKHDLSCFWLLRRVGNVLWTARVLVFAKTLFRDQLAAAVQMLQDNSIVRCCVDSTGIGAMMAEELKLQFGYRVEEVQFTNNVKMDMGMPMLQAFEDRGVRIPDSSEIREDLHKVRKTATKSGNVRLEAESDDEGHADRFWALALALHAANAKADAGPIHVFKTHRNDVISARRSREVVAA